MSETPSTAHSTTPASPSVLPPKPITPLSSVTIRFAGDSGDGMQLVGMQFSDTSALAGNDISTFPDYPSEIRAPAGTVAGVSGFQIQFSSHDIFTPGDDVDVLVAMNPAALKSNLKSVKMLGANSMIIVNQDAFIPAELKKAGYEANPLDDGSLASYRVIPVPIDKLNAAALKETGLAAKQVDMCKNFFALGLVYWLYDRRLDSTLQYVQKKFGKKNPQMAKADELSLKAGYHYGETAEFLPQQYQVPKAADLPAGTYRRVNGNEAIVLGLATAAHLSGKQLVYPSYPITPATDILHGLAELKHFGVITFQAEDEICAMGAAIGAAFGGALAVTGTSGPGLALKTEAINLAVMTELPVVIVNVQRGGPSTGLPTKTEQADLFQSLFGRNGESPVPVIAAASPGDCYMAAIEACRVAIKYMTPVLLLSDGYVANSSEPWRIPNVDTMPPIEAKHPTEPLSAPFQPYRRNKDLVRPWAIPGTPGYEHRIGGLEKQDVIGCVSYEPANHETMVQLRNAKIAGIKPPGVPLIWTGNRAGDVLVLGWGGTYGAIKAATLELEKEGLRASACHLRYLNPLPEDLLERMNRFAHIVVAELNLGQLAWLLKARYRIDAKTINKVRGQPFTIQEIVGGVKRILAEGSAAKASPRPEIKVSPGKTWVQDDQVHRPSCGTFTDEDEE